MGDERQRLAELVQSQAQGRPAWESAEMHLLEAELRRRLEVLRVEVTPEVAVALMAAAMLLCQGAPEWGGDSRDVLGQLAALGLSLFD